MEMLMIEKYNNIHVIYAEHNIHMALEKVINYDVVNMLSGICDSINHFYDVI